MTFENKNSFLLFLPLISPSCLKSSWVINAIYLPSQGASFFSSQLTHWPVFCQLPLFPWIFSAEKAKIEVF